MKTLLPGNVNPKSGQLTFANVHKVLMEVGNGVASLSSEVGVGNNTTAKFRRVGHDDPQAIEIKYHDTIVAVLYDDDSVRLNSGGFDTVSTIHRMDWAVLPLGFRVCTIRKKMKVYSISTGAYKDFHDGMIVSKGGF